MRMRKKTPARHRHRPHRSNRHTRRHRKQSGGAEHIYSIPLKSMFDVVYALGSELMNLRSQCVSKCVAKISYLITEEWIQIIITIIVCWCCGITIQ